MEEVILTALKIDDQIEISKFLKILNQNYEDVPFAANEKSLKDSNKKMFWATCLESKEIVGTAGYVEKTPLLAETIKTVVDKKFQGQGFGKAISKAIENKCKQEGIKKVMTTIYTKNHKMISIKLAQGYTIEGFHPSHEAPGWDEYSLGKILS